MAHPDQPNRSSKRRRTGSALVAALAFVVTLAAACSDASNPGQAGGSSGNDATTNSCASPNEGCPCSSNGASIDCGEVVTHSGDYVTCSMGKRTCAGGHWGACVGDHVVFKSYTPITYSGGGIHSADYGMPVACTNNPCDPDCQNIPDNSVGVDAATLRPSDGGFTLPDVTPPADANANNCQGIQCQVVTCADGGVNGTKLTGKVYDPAGLNPIYNALVAVPAGAVPVPPTGVPRPAGPCGGVTLPPVVTYTNTAYDGSFTLTGVPAGANVPILIQSGQWQRTITLTVPQCATTNISPAASCGNGNLACQTRLPRVQAEGHIPKIAIGSGGLDAMECLLYRMGIASSEFTDESGSGRVHVFNNGGATLASPAANHDVSYLLGFRCATGQCPGTITNSTTNITNPSFETGNITGWAASALVGASNAQAIAGTWSALMGSTSAAQTGTETLAQTFTAPANAGGISFNLRSQCNNNQDGFSALLHDNTTNTDIASWARNCTTLGAGWWTYTATNVLPAHSYTLTFTNKDTRSGSITYSYVDNVQWQILPAQPASLLNNYDLVMLPCNGGGEYGSADWGGQTTDYDDVGRTNLKGYADIGGRLFTSHWGREWIERPSVTWASGPFPSVAPWYGDGATPWGGSSDPLVGYIDNTTTRGNDFSQWMNVTVGSLTTFNISPSRFDANANLPAGSTRFVYAWSDNNPAGHPGNPDAVMDFTFDTPLGGTPSGRVMFTDMHLASGTPSGTFPGNCPAQGTALTAQEKAAEYLLFDLGSCVGSQLPPVVIVPPVWYDPGSVKRTYNPTCAAGKHVKWRFFYWEDIIPGVDAGTTSANIVFSAKTAQTAGGLATAPSVNLATVTTTNLSFVGVDVGAALATIPSPSYDFLELTFTLNPSSDHQTAPTLLAWQLTYDCVDSE